jgi:nicotinamidase-related amidase
VDDHPSFPDRAPVALLLIDVINDLEFDGGERLLAHALPMAERLAALKTRAASKGIPAVYVNDNFGRWKSDFRKQVAHCLQDGVRGEPVARLLAPAEDDYFVLKPKNSAFYGTTLATLLEHLGTQTVILTGIACNICVLFTANDAHMRGYQVVVPSDCVASEHPQDTASALGLMERALYAEVCPSEQLTLVR